MSNNIQPPFFNEEQEKDLIKVTSNFIQHVRTHLSTQDLQYPDSIDIAERSAVTILLGQLSIFHCTRCERDFNIDYAKEYNELFKHNLPLPIRLHNCPQCGVADNVVPYHAYRAEQLLNEIANLETKIKFLNHVVEKQKNCIVEVEKVLQERGLEIVDISRISPILAGMLEYFNGLEKEIVKLRMITNGYNKTS